MTAVLSAGADLLVRSASAVRALSGWRRYGLAFVLGALAAAAMPPVHAIPVLLISFPGLIWLLDGAATRRAAFFVGWWFGWGHFIVGLYWIANAMLTDPAKFGWMIPFAVGGLSAYLAVYPGLAAWAVKALRLAGLGRVLGLAVAWTVAEWVRGHALTGFPWNLAGSVWTAVPGVLQFAAVAGVYGLSLLTVLIAAAPAVLGDAAPRSSWRPVAAAAGLLALLWVGGEIRLAATPTQNVGGVTVRVVQPNIDQTLKWRRDLQRDHVLKLVRLSKTGATTPSIVIWPETAAPFFVANDALGRQALALAVPKGGLLITGSLRRTEPGQSPFQIWNSVNAVDEHGQVRATYDKHHLVPYGEYVPFRSVIDTGKLTIGGTDFSRGPGPRTLTLPGLPPVSPLVCYEVIFPGAVTQKGHRPGWLLNVTNDGWFGISAGPYQHLASAQMRAVEEGLPLVRAANTGISAVFDPVGRTVVRLPLGQEGAADAALPTALPPTFYARFGDGATLALALVAVIAVLGLRKR